MSFSLASLWVIVYGVGAVSVGLATYFWRATLYKLRLYFRAVVYLLLSGDSKWKTTDVPDPGQLPTNARITKKKVIFVRHGESNWNETFNRGYNPIFFIPRVIYACIYEWYLLIQGTRDSWFYDSSLSYLGMEQANGLRQAILSGASDNSSDLRYLAGNSEVPTVIVSSPLRRAISTAVFSMQDRLKAKEEKVIVLPYLQEISRNMDTLPLTPPYTPPIPSWIEAQEQGLDVAKMYSDRVDVTQYSGNKQLKSTGLSRMLGFNKWLFSRPAEEVTIVHGHSLWFLAYFRTFLPRGSMSPAKLKKLRNCAVVSFIVLCAVGPDGTEHYAIDEATITESHLGFAK